MTAQEILVEIKPLGRDSYRKVLFNHGIPEPCYGVKIEELKKIQKRIKSDYRVALDPRPTPDSVRPSNRRKNRPRQRGRRQHILPGPLRSRLDSKSGKAGCHRQKAQERQVLTWPCATAL